MIDRLTACWSVSQGAEALVAGASIVTSFMGARSFFDTNVLVILGEIRAVQNVAGGEQVVSSRNSTQVVTRVHKGLHFKLRDDAALAAF